MRTLPLYADGLPTHAAVELATPVDRDSFETVGLLDKGRACDRCVLGTREWSKHPKDRIRSPCIAANGLPGGLLIVGDAVGKGEDDVGRPFAGEGGAFLREQLSRHWNGPVAFDSAIRCYPKGQDLKPKMVNACRGFLAHTLEEVKPTRIIAMGPWAAFALFGRSVAPFSTRGGYAYLRNGNDPTPVFFVLPPIAALRNRFVRGWFERDLRHALTADDPPYGPWEAEVRIIENEADALVAEAELSSQKWLSFDVETAGPMWTPDFRMLSVAVCGYKHDDPYVWGPTALADAGALTVLLRIMASKRVKKIGQNVKYDQLAFRARYGICVRPIEGDTRLQRKLLEPEASGALPAMAELVGMGGLKQEAELVMAAITKKIQAALRKKDPIDRDYAFEMLKLPPVTEKYLRAGAPIAEHKYGLLPEDVLVRYNARDAVATARLERMLEEQLRLEPALQRTWDNLVKPAASALERVEGWGIGVSRSAVEMFDHMLERRENALKVQLDQYPDVNWDSVPQVRNLLFNTLGLQSVKQTKKGSLSTDGEVLEELSKHHPLPKNLLDYRFVTKLRGTYASGMMPHIRPDGRIHPNIKLDGARSGRTSCTDPNLQNIPRAQTPEGKLARDCFVAADECTLLEVDYSQLELRVAAMLSGDPAMAEIFSSGVDYHFRTAQLVSKVAWGIEPHQVTDQHRSWAKSVNFGVLYGKTAHTLAEEWGISRAKADVIVEAIMGNFRELQKWISKRHSEAQKNGCVWTQWAGKPARRRPLWRIADRDDYAASVAKNGAVNSPVQGTASDYLVASLVESVNWIEQDGIENDVKLCLPVHDSLMFEVRRTMVEEVVHTVHEIMTGWPSDGIPLVADFKVGKSWGSMSRLTIEGGKVVVHDKS